METLVSDASLREAVIGDLREEYRELASRETRGVATRWYWSQLARSTLPFAALSLARGSALDRMRFVAGVLGGYAVIIVLLVVSLWAVGWGFAFADQSNYVSGVLAFGTMPGLVLVWSLVMAAVSGIAAGYVAARVGDRTAVAAALTLGLLGVPLCGFTVVPDIATAPIWFRAALSAVLLPSVMGGALFRRRPAT